MRRIALVRLLLAHIAGPDLRRIPHPDLVSQLHHQIEKPLAVPGSFHSNQRRRRQRGVKPSCLSATVLELTLGSLSSFRVHPNYLLPRRMEITAYNNHKKAPSSLQNSWSSTERYSGVRVGAFVLMQSTFRPPRRR